MGHGIVLSSHLEQARADEKERKKKLEKERSASLASWVTAQHDELLASWAAAPPAESANREVYDDFVRMWKIAEEPKPPPELLTPAMLSWVRSFNNQKSQRYRKEANAIAARSRINARRSYNSLMAMQVQPLSHFGFAGPGSWSEQKVLEIAVQGRKGHEFLARHGYRGAHI